MLQKLGAIRIVMGWGEGGYKKYFLQGEILMKKIHACRVALGQILMLLHLCAEPNWWIKHSKRAASEAIWYDSFSFVKQKH